MDDKVQKIVSAAVIKALAENGPDILADKTAEILTQKDGGYDMWGMLRGYSRDETTYLERLVADEIKALSKAAVAEWVAGHADAIKAGVVAKIDAEAIADTFIANLIETVEDGDVEVRVSVPHPVADDDD